MHDRRGLPEQHRLPFGIRIGPANLAFSQPWGAWGYLGAAEAQQYGFRVPAGSALSALGIDAATPGNNPASLPQAEQNAIGKCATIEQNFTNAAQNGALAGIDTLSNDLYNDVAKDGTVSSATQAWKACMARNGYSFTQPQNVFFQELQSMFGGKRSITPGETVSPAADQAQIATAVTDADCTDSTDLAGIYFAVQASYEQQIVNANQQALTAAVQQYRAAYAKELNKLPGLLKTASAQPFSSAKPGQPTSPAPAHLSQRLTGKRGSRHIPLGIGLRIRSIRLARWSVARRADIKSRYERLYPRDLIGGPSHHRVTGCRQRFGPLTVILREPADDADRRPQLQAHLTQPPRHLRRRPAGGGLRGTTRAHLLRNPGQRRGE